MKRMFASLVALAIGVLVPAVSEALAITPTSGVLNVSRWEGNENDQPGIDTAIAPLIGTTPEVYKQNVGGSESGSLASSYQTSFFNAPNDPADATISYVGGPVAGNPSYLLVKDGSQTPAWYLFDLSETLTGLDWNGTDPLVLTGFWPQQGAISHVTLYAGTGSGSQGVSRSSTETVTPEPASMLLLGTGLAALAARARRRKTTR